MPKGQRGSIVSFASQSPMPFGWEGFDALFYWEVAIVCQDGSPMPFGWEGFDASRKRPRTWRSAPVSPMPFGWEGFDAMALLPPERRDGHGLQCLSAGRALMPGLVMLSSCNIYVVSNAFRLGGL